VTTGSAIRAWHLSRTPLIAEASQSKPKTQLIVVATDGWTPWGEPGAGWHTRGGVHHRTDANHRPTGMGEVRHASMTKTAARLASPPERTIKIVKK
jgi:hypothetical protein